MPKGSKRYNTDILIKSRMFRGLQEDFLKAILTEKEYTKEDAIKKINTFKGGN